MMGAWLINTPTFQPDNQGKDQFGVLACLDDTIGYGGTVDYATKYRGSRGDSTVQIVCYTILYTLDCI